MSENGAPTPHLAIKFSSIGPIAAIALEQKGLAQYGVKFFARWIPQTGVRRSINASDGEHSMKALRVAAATVCEAVKAIPHETQWVITKQTARWNQPLEQ